MKIVVAVDQDKQTIVKRTGQSAYFAIYENDKLIDLVPNKHHDGNHHSHNHNHSHLNEEDHTNSHRKDIVHLKNCDIILVKALGRNMKEALESIGLKVEKIKQKNITTAEDAVKNFLNQQK